MLVKKKCQTPAYAYSLEKLKIAIGRLGRFVERLKVSIHSLFKCVQSRYNILNYQKILDFSMEGTYNKDNYQTETDFVLAMNIMKGETLIRNCWGCVN